jgi:hypothetical protein
MLFEVITKLDINILMVFPIITKLYILERSMTKMIKE